MIEGEHTLFLLLSFPFKCTHTYRTDTHTRTQYRHTLGNSHSCRNLDSELPCDFMHKIYAKLHDISQYQGSNATVLKALKIKAWLLVEMLLLNTVERCIDTGTVVHTDLFTESLCLSATA